MQSVLPIDVRCHQGRGRHAPTDASRRREDLMFREFAETRSERLRETLVEQFMPLAQSLASRYRRQSEPMDDLIQVACVGLVNAIDRFEPERGRPFAAFATPTILGELRRHFRDRVWTLRLPRSLSELAMRLDQAEAELTEQLGHRPSAEEIGTHLSIPADQVREGQRAKQARQLRSLDVPAASVEGLPPMIETVATADRGYERVEAQLAAVDAKLADRERTVLRLHFDEGMTQQQIGEIIGVSQMQVSRINRGALSKLLSAVRGEQTDAPVSQAA